MRRSEVSTLIHEVESRGLSELGPWVTDAVHTRRGHLFALERLRFLLTQSDADARAIRAYGAAAMPHQLDGSPYGKKAKKSEAAKRRFQHFVLGRTLEKGWFDAGVLRGRLGNWRAAIMLDTSVSESMRTLLFAEADRDLAAVRIIERELGRARAIKELNGRLWLNDYINPGEQVLYVAAYPHYINRPVEEETTGRTWIKIGESDDPDNRTRTLTRQTGACENLTVYVIIREGATGPDALTDGLIHRELDAMQVARSNATGQRTGREFRMTTLEEVMAIANHLGLRCEDVRVGTERVIVPASQSIQKGGA